MPPEALDLPGPSRRIVVEPLEQPRPARDPEPAPAPAPREKPEPKKEPVRA